MENKEEIKIADYLSKKVLLIVHHEFLIKKIESVLTNVEVVEFVETFDLKNIQLKIQNIQPSLIILESPWDNGISTLEVAEIIRSQDRRFPIILVTCQGSESLAVSALKIGIKGYFKLPINDKEFNDTIIECITNYCRQSITRQNRLLNSPVEQVLVGNSFQLSRLKKYLKKIAVVDSNVLITGETGTGKEVVANYIHKLSSKNSKPFIALNCAAIPDGLLEGELFGYEKGSFTGAQASYIGKLRLAHGGIVFFDEIGDMSPYAQAKLLRVIESKEVYPLGAKRSVPLDIRIIAATNCDLESMILKKEFRHDLYYRLNVARVNLPPLREHKEDIPCLINFFLANFNINSKKKIKGLSDDALHTLLTYEWPGNVRELKNCLETIFIDPPLGLVGINDLPEWIWGNGKKQERTNSAECDKLLKVLSSVHWNKSKAAEQLNWSRMTLYRKMAKYQIVQSQTIPND